MYKGPRRNSNTPTAIREKYKGVWFRSRLEVRWARFFDDYNTLWSYEPEGFVLNKDLCYLPDFWLPEIKTIVEVKGIFDNNSKNKVFSIVVPASKQGIMTILASDPAGRNYWLVNPSPQCFRSSDAEIPTPSLSKDIAFVRCSRCRKYFFLGVLSTWYCTACGFHGGIQTFESVHEDSPGFSGWKMKGT